MTNLPFNPFHDSWVENDEQNLSLSKGQIQQQQQQQQQQHQQTLFFDLYISTLDY